MRKSFLILGVVVALGFLATGCAGPERKLGRGFSNTFEVVRWGEMRREIEQGALFNPDQGYASGAVRGFNRSIARIGIGIYEVVTFPIPIPNYDPVATDYLKPHPVYPDSYKPHLVEGSTFATDTAIGFSGGDVAPLIPGSRFRIFDN